MVSSEMSMSTDGGMSAGLALMARVNSCWSTMPSPCCTSMGSPTRLMVTSARDHLVPTDDLEVDMGHHVLERVVLDVAGQGEEVLPVDLAGRAGC